MPAGCVFSVAKGLLHSKTQATTSLLALTLARDFRSTYFHACCCCSLGGGWHSIRTKSGLIQRTPIPAHRGRRIAYLCLHWLARRAWSLKRSLDTRTETSHAFTLPALLQVEGDIRLRSARQRLDQRTSAAIEAELAAIQAEIDEQLLRPLRHR